MIKFVKRYLDTDSFKIALTFALLHFLLFNSASFIVKFTYIKPTIITACLELVKDFIYNMIILCLLFYGLMLHRFLFVTCSLFIFSVSAGAAYYLLLFGITPSVAMIGSVFSTNFNEANELISIQLALWVTCALALCLYAMIKAKTLQARSMFGRLLSLICLLVAVENIITPHFGFLRTSLPVQYLHNSYIYWLGDTKTYPRVEINSKFNFKDLAEEEIIGVLVIGESARYDHFGINGYHRDTTPYLAKMSEEIVSYKAESCGNATHISVPCMLSRYKKQEKHLVDTETSLCGALTKLGFETVLVGSQSITKYYRNRKIGSFYDDLSFYLIPGGSMLMTHHSYDENLLPYFEQNLNKPGKKFLILHTNGSHWHYSKRYRPEFDKFKPSMSPDARQDAFNSDRTEFVNSYDNSILYTDFILSQIIELLKNKNAFLIYSSDHGESLGDEGRLGHGHDKEYPEQIQVPFLVWFSDQYKATHMDEWNYIKSKSAEEISHDYIFHTILDCLHIESDAVEKELSLCAAPKNKK
jgi:glucan phosphoethanolaminetransferase (alkaline phosphatase superfamily)